MARDGPEGRHDEPLGVVDPRRLDQLLEACPEVRELTRRDRPRGLVGASSPEVAETHHQIEVPVGVRAAKAVALAACSELLSGELTHRFEQPKPCLCPFVDGHQKRTCDKSVEPVHDLIVRPISRAGERFGGGEGERPGEDRGPGQQHPLGWRQQLVGPLEGGSQRAMSLGRRPPTTGQQSEHVIEPVRDFGRSQRSSPRCGELERERNAVETLTDLHDRLTIANRIQRSAYLLRSHLE